jgi:hypothetical protein
MIIGGYPDMPTGQHHHGAAALARGGPFATVRMLRVAKRASAHGVATIEFELSQVGPTFLPLDRSDRQWKSP